MSKITAEYARSRIHYDPSTGRLYWKRKAETTSIDKMWNKRFAGAEINRKLACGHIQFRIDGQNLLAHRVAWLIAYDAWPDGILDHANRDPADNRLSNLRPASRTENAANSRNRRQNTSGYRGVVFQSGKWVARVSAGNKKFYAGSFSTREAAAEAYNKLAGKLHGEFAQFNTVGGCHF